MMWVNINKIIGKSKDKLHTRSLLMNEREFFDETDGANTLNNNFTAIDPKLDSTIPTTDISPLRNKPTISSSQLFFLYPVCYIVCNIKNNMKKPQLDQYQPVY